MSSMGLASVMSDPLIRPISSAPSPRAVLLAFPHAGGGARLFRPTLRAGYEVLESWRPRPSPIDVPIIEIHGADDHSLGGRDGRTPGDPGDADRWRAATTGPFRSIGRAGAGRAGAGQSPRIRTG